MTHDVIVLGGGAAGLMCAIEAGKRGRRVLVIESNDVVGRKILISGGGRCNFTNETAGSENYISSNPDFARSALARYTPQDFIGLVEAHGIAYHEKKLGQLFCDGSATAIVGMLLSECADASVDILTGCRVDGVEHDTHFTVETNRGAFECESLVVATGGLSIPKIGATDFGYRLACQFGLEVVTPRPGLVPLTFAGEEREFFADLSGASIAAEVRANGRTFRENVLFTHRGLSGPAILQVSSYWSPGDNIEIDLAPGASVIEDRAGQRRDLPELLSDTLPRRFAQGWSDRYGPSGPLHRLSGTEIAALEEQLHHWRLTPAGTLGFDKAEVTVGGIDTRELSSKTMEARRVPGLFFVGEVVDVTGWLGGYNFQWAWASGFAAGQYV